VAQRRDRTHRRADEHDALSALRCQRYCGGDVVRLEIAERRMAARAAVTPGVVPDDVESAVVERAHEREDVGVL
jgi:hypothetical protein